MSEAAIRVLSSSSQVTTRELPAGELQMAENNNTCGGGKACEAVCPLLRPGLPCVDLAELVHFYRTIIPQLAG
jgi:hypothetical protein